MDKLVERLQRLDLPVNYRSSNYVATSTSYRDGDTPTGLLVYENNLWDSVALKRYTWPEFVSLVKKIPLSEAQKWLDGAEIEDGVYEKKEPKIKQEKVLDEEDFTDLLPSYEFFLKRGISERTLQIFGAGLSQSGSMYGRVCFQIRNEFGDLVGMAGRDVLNRDIKKKWKNKGNKSSWIYPLFQEVEQAIDNTNQIVLVESIGDTLSLFDSGIRQVLCNFGLSLSPERLYHILGKNLNQIFVSLNNDMEGDKNRGQIATSKILSKLKPFFKASKIVTAPPFKNDFGDQDTELNYKWAIKHGIQINKND